MALGLLLLAQFTRPAVSVGQDTAWPVEATLTLTKGAFLSSEWPTASLDIHNLSDAELTLNQRSLAILEIQSDGTPRMPLGESWSGVSRLDHIATGGHFRATYRLPTCTVVAKSCHLTVAVRYELTREGSRPRVLQTAPVTYERRADPTATFEIPEFSGNRLVVMTTGSAQDTLFADSVVIELFADSRAPHSPLVPSPKLINDVVQVFARHGLSLSSMGFSAERKPWKIVLRITAASTQRSQIGAAIDDVRDHFIGRIGSVTHHLALDDELIFPVVTVAEAAANAAARRFARAVGVGDVSLVNEGGDQLLLSGPPGSTLEFAGGGGVPSQSFAPRLDVPPPAAIAVAVQYRATFIASSDLVDFPFPMSILKSVRDYDGAQDGQGAWPSNPLTIEADRSELYAVGRADESQALRAGLDPTLTALSFAHREAVDIGALLGLRLVRPSLVVVPRADGYGSDSVVALSGLAMTIEPADAEQFAKLPFAISPPTGAGGGVVEASSAELPVPFVPNDPATTLTEYVSARLGVVGDARRIDISLSSAGLGKAHSTLEDVVFLLRGQSDVLDVAVRTPTKGSPDLGGFEVVLRSTNRAGDAHLFEILRKSLGQNVAIRATESALLTDCKTLKRKVLAEAFGTAREYATHRTWGKPFRLRKLLIAAAFPVQVDDDGCSLAARRGDTAFTGAVDEETLATRDLQRTVFAAASVELAYRTEARP